MSQSKHEYSLLGKLETFEDFSRKVLAMPLLVIPGVKDLSQISSWESDNSIPKEHTFDSIGRMITGWYKLQ